MALKVRKVADTFNAIFAKGEIQLPYFPSCNIGKFML